MTAGGDRRGSRVFGEGSGLLNPDAPAIIAVEDCESLRVPFPFLPPARAVYAAHPEPLEPGGGPDRAFP
jgi:hypothetical protein